MQPVIRRIKRSDASEIQTAVLESVGHIRPWLDWCTPGYRLSDAVNWTVGAVSKWQEGSEYRFVIEESESGVLLGSIAIRSICGPSRIGDLGYWLRKRALGQGYCTKAVKLALEYGFEELGFQRIEMRVLPDNAASNAVAFRLGAAFDGLQANKIIHKGETKMANCYSFAAPVSFRQTYKNAGIALVDTRVKSVSGF